MAGAGSVENEAFVTLATNDTYSLGALVLANSLRRVGTTRKLVIMVTPGVSQGMRQQLSDVFDLVTQVDVLDSRDTANLALLTRPDLGVTFTKLHCWRLTQFTKCVFLDADTLVLQNCDELFDREELSAAPDPGWPDCFNSGVFVYCPSEQTYQSLLEFAMSVGSFDGGDQGLLNLYFSDWATKDIKKHLPFIYNVVSQTFYSYLPAFRQFGKNVKIVHFIGAMKPWHAVYNTATGHVETQVETYHHQEYLQLWWTIFMEKVNPSLDPSVAHLTNLIHRLPRCTCFSPPSSGACPPPSSARYSEPSHMTSPYVPPDLPVFYEPPAASSSADEATDARLIALPSPDRQYCHLENFFSEPPMANGCDYPNADETYWCREQQAFLGELQQAELRDDDCEEIGSSDSSTDVRQTPDSTDSVCEDETASRQTDQQEPANYAADSKDDDAGDKSKSLDQSESKPSDIFFKQNAIRCSGCPNASISQSENCSALSRDSVLANHRDSVTGRSEDDVSMGLVGELASLRLDTGKPYTKEQLRDRQRQYAWERGQVDYLGMDSFELIKSHIEDVVSGKSPAAAAAAAAASTPDAGEQQP